MLQGQASLSMLVAQLSCTTCGMSNTYSVTDTTCGMSNTYSVTDTYPVL